MNKNLWLIILVMAVFMGFLGGYSSSSFYHFGLLGNKGNLQGNEIDKDMEKYYQELLKEE